VKPSENKIMKFGIYQKLLYRNHLW